AENASITSACAAVMHGTIPVGGTGCSSSWECVPGSFCDPTVGGGTCTFLVGQGGACGTKALNDEMCAYLSTHNPPQFCNAINGSMTCAPLQADGANCMDSMGNFYDLSCTSELCGSQN